MFPVHFYNIKFCVGSGQHKTQIYMLFVFQVSRCEFRFEFYKSGGYNGIRPMKHEEKALNLKSTRLPIYVSDSLRFNLCTVTLDDLSVNLSVWFHKQAPH